MTRAEKDRASREQPGGTIWWFPETRKALLGWLTGNTEAPVNQSGLKREKVKVTGKKAEKHTSQSYRGGGGQGTKASALLQPLCA